MYKVPGKRPRAAERARHVERVKRQSLIGDTNILRFGRAVAEQRYEASLTPVKPKRPRKPRAKKAPTPATVEA